MLELQAQSMPSPDHEMARSSAAQLRRTSDPDHVPSPIPLSLSGARAGLLASNTFKRRGHVISMLSPADRECYNARRCDARMENTVGPFQNGFLQKPLQSPYAICIFCKFVCMPLASSHAVDEKDHNQSDKRMIE